MTDSANLDYPAWKKWTNISLFWFMHVSIAFTLWMNVETSDFILCGVLYVVRMFGVTAGYHRYFSHRAYKMGRVTQFFMALLAMTAAQKGPLWWASHHRHHHKHSDDEHDVHSPSQRGFWYAHIGWVLDPRWEHTDESRVRDLVKFPELVFINRYPVAPTFMLGVLCYLIGDWEGLLIGHFLSTVLLWHGTFTINSLSHVIGTRRYDTKDDSRNHWLLAIITMGEGWHNNHHHYQSSAKQGFFWWEIDLTYYILKVMSWCGLVWDLRVPPAHVIEGNRRKRAQVEPETEAETQPLVPQNS